MPSSAPPPGSIRSVGVLGGGTAGYFAALAIKKRFPSTEVTVVESSTVPIIGVGEATTTLMPPFLHGELGIDPVELFAAVRPTFKLGIKFIWGAPGDDYFTYPFGPADTLEAFLHDGDVRTQSLTSILMGEDRFPIFEDESGALRSSLPETKFAYHLHNAPFVGFLARTAHAWGIAHVDALVAEVVAPADHSRIDAIVLADGRSMRFDLYVDASGFRSRLMGEALGSPFESYASSLFCDSALVADAPAREVISPYTEATTMEAGWRWRIPVEDAEHLGYVFSSAFLDEARAETELRAMHPGLTNVRTVRFRSGRHRDFVRGNTFALGNAYGFVEPLESTALHMVIVELQYLLAFIEASAMAPLDADTLNHRVGAHWDFLRWFLAVHYKFNRRSESEFWRSCRADVDVSGIESTLEDILAYGNSPSAGTAAGRVADPAFGPNGLMIMLLGQKVGSPRGAPRVSAALWHSRVAAQRDAATHALDQRRALAVLHARPDLLREMVHAPSGWCARGEEIVRVSSRTGEAALPHTPRPRSRSR